MFVLVDKLTSKQVDELILQVDKLTSKQVEELILQVDELLVSKSLNLFTRQLVYLSTKLLIQYLNLLAHRFLMHLLKNLLYKLSPHAT